MLCWLATCIVTKDSTLASDHLSNHSWWVASHPIHLPWISPSLSIHQLLSRWLAELPISLDSFYWHSQYHQHFFRMGGRESERWADSHKVVGKECIDTENSQMVSIGDIFTSTYHTK